MCENFVPETSVWVSSHYYDVPNETVEFCGSIAGATVLNLGCGEMLADFGLLCHNVKKVVGLDLDNRTSDHLELVAKKLQHHGILPAADYRERLDYRYYDGHDLPFGDGEFDLLFSWSAFEHIHNVPRVLSEIRRVLRDDGRAFIQTYPWYHAFDGSHLTDYIREPYMQLSRSREWVRERLEEYVSAHPGSRDQILGYMLPQYLSLNGYSADRFYGDVVEAGFRVTKARVISYDLDLSDLPPPTRFSEAMICGTKMLLQKRIVPACPAPPIEGGR
ncbi:MAG TPA: class I SAM-dependent methyltransferase [Paludibaculum sp.]|jgi:SAM-dependent methyltransferase